MRSRRVNEYGIAPAYGPGDRVKIWRIKGYPIGSVERVVDPSAHPMKYLVRYVYEDTGKVYVEEFERSDLALFERFHNYECNCHTASRVHASWCNNKNTYRWEP